MRDLVVVGPLVDVGQAEDERQAEEQVLLGLKLRNCVIATGGSAVYSQPAMRSVDRTTNVVNSRPLRFVSSDA